MTDRICDSPSYISTMAEVNVGAGDITLCYSDNKLTL